MIHLIRRRKRWSAVSTMALLAFLLLLTVHSQSGLQVGYAVVSVDEDGALPVATALFSLRNNDGILVAEAGVAAVEAVRAGRIFVDAAIPTGFALANPSDSNLHLTLTLRTSRGSVVDRVGFELPARQQRALFVSDPELFGALPEGFVGSATFETDGPEGVAALTIRQGRNTHNDPLFATLPVAPLGIDPDIPPSSSRSLVFPHVGAGDSLTTQILLINPRSDAIRGEIRLTGPEGQPLELTLDGRQGSAFPYELAPDGVFQGTLTSNAGVLSGYAVVTTEGGVEPPAGVAVFQFRDEAGNLVSEAGVGATEATTRARIFVDTIDTRTGVALANPANGEAGVEFLLRDRNGLDFAATTRTLAANGHLSIFADELFEALPTGFTGVLEIWSTAPVVPTTLKLTVNQRGDRILTTLPVADLTRPPVGERLIFPHLGFGSGLSTRLLLINTGDQTATTGTLRFIQVTGGELVVPLLGRDATDFAFDVPPSGAIQLRPGDRAIAVAIVLDPVAALQITVSAQGSRLVRPVVVDSAGALRDDLPLRFQSLDQQVAIVDGTGRILGREEGFSTLTITSGAAMTATTIAVVRQVSGAPGYGSNHAVPDGAGRLYLASLRDHAILRVDNLAQTPDVYAGSVGVSGFRNGARLEALFSQPAFLSLNRAGGALYASDTRNHRIRRLLLGRDGIVDTLAGSGAPGAEDGAAEAATFEEPVGIALDPRGRLWVADSGSHTIRRVDLSKGTVETIAGRAGVAGLRDGNGQEALFNAPAGIALEPEPLGRQYERIPEGTPPPPVTILVADSANGVIRRVDENGLVTTVGGVLANPRSKLGGAAVPEGAIFDRPMAVAADSIGNIYVSDQGSGNVRTILTTGVVVDAAGPGTFSEPSGIAIAASGRVVVADGNQTGVELVYGAPRIDEIIPSDPSPGQSVMIRGRNFSPESLLVVFDQVLDDPNIVEDTGTIRFRLPEVPSGSLTLTVQNRAGIAQSSIEVEPVALDRLAPGGITTIAGGEFNFVGDGMVATQATLQYPVGVSGDSLGNLYVVDAAAHRVRRIDSTTGTIITVAGNGQRGGSFGGAFSGDGGPATAASLNVPQGIAFTPDGDLVIADSGNQRVRRVDTARDITTVAGGGCCFFGDGGPATSAGLGFVNDAVSDAGGNIYIADSSNHRVRRVDAVSGIITTVAGNGRTTVTGRDAQNGGIPVEAGGSFSGDGGPAIVAGLDSPTAVALDGEGGLFIADSGNDRVRRVDLGTGLIETIAGGGGDSQTLGDGGPAIDAVLARPMGLCSDSTGRRLLVADTDNHRVRQVDLDTGIITTVAGGADPGNSLGGQRWGRGDGGPGVEAELLSPTGLAIAPDGDILIADPGNGRVRSVDSQTGIIDTVAGGAPAVRSFAIVTDESLVVINGDVIQRIDLTSGTVTRIAGGGSPSDGNGDGGPAVEARFDFPHALAVDAAGNVFVGEGFTAFPGSPPRIRRIDHSTGIISTVAGGGTPPDGVGDGGPATEAALDDFSDLAFDSNGNLFVAESGPHAFGSMVEVAGFGEGSIRRIDAATGHISTVAQVEARAIGVDAEGNVLFLPQSPARVQKIDPTTGTITTVAGGGEEPLVEGIPATDAKLIDPVDLVVEPDGSFSVLESPPAIISGVPAKHRIRRVDRVSGTIVTIVGGASLESGNGDGNIATEAILTSPEGFGLNSEGDYLIADSGTIRVVASDSMVIETVYSPFEDGLDATAASLVAGDVAVDAAGAILIADSDRVRTVDPATGIIGTLAGGGAPADGVGDAGPATEARLAPGGISVDPEGNTLVADPFSRRVRRIESATGVIGTVAGVTISPVGYGGPATGADLVDPSNVAVDRFGNLFIRDLDGVSRVDAMTGVIQQVHRRLSPCVFSCEGGLALDSEGNLYVSVSVLNLVLKVDSRTGVTSIVAGREPLDVDLFGRTTGGFSGDGGPATEALFDLPTGLAFDIGGNLLIADTGNNRIRRVNLQTGVVTTVAGRGTPSFSGDRGPSLSASLNGPKGVFSDAAGNLFIADSGNARIRRVDAVSGIITTVAGRTPSAPPILKDTEAATSVELSPTSVTVAPEGGPVFSDLRSFLVARIEPDGTVRTIAGGGLKVLFDDGDSALSIALSPFKLAYGPGGDLFVVSRAGIGGLLRIGGDGKVYSVSEYSQYSSIAFLPNGDLLGLSVFTVDRIDPGGGDPTTLAGTQWVSCCSGEGVPLNRATFDDPQGVAVDRSGFIYVSDTGRHRVRRIDLDLGKVTTVAGRADDIFSLGKCGFSGDGGPAESAELCLPGALVVENGNLFIADTGNNRIRRIDLQTGVISTIAGTGESRPGADGGPAANTSIIPIDLAFDQAGNLLVAEGPPSNRIRIIRGPIP